MSDVSCICTPGHRTVLSCSSSVDCGVNEVCAYSCITEQPFCVSCSILSRDSTYTPVNAVASTAVCGATFTPPPPPDYLVASNGANYDQCSLDAQCRDDRVCVKKSDSSPCELGSEEGFCMCMPPIKDICSSSEDCARDELCGEVLDELTGKVKDTTCLSKRILHLLHNSNVRPVNPADMAPGGGEADKESGDGHAVYTGDFDDVGTGLAFDECKYDWDCAGSRRCTHATGSYGGCAGRRACTCKPLFRPPCTQVADCPDGETCANVPDARTRNLCISKAALPNLWPNVAISELDSFDAVDVPPGTGLVSDACKLDSDCKGARVCVHATEWFAACNGRRACSCEEYVDGRLGVTCLSEDDCTDGELCFRSLDNTDRKGTCISPNFRSDVRARKYEVINETPTLEHDEGASSPDVDNGGDESTLAEPSADPHPPGSGTGFGAVDSALASPLPDDRFNSNNGLDEAACIAVGSLSRAGVTEANLLYASHRRASVLCDKDGNCATGGHVVVWQGMPMMMRTYCAQHASCVHRVMFVNSPRMRSGLRVASATRGLSFSAHAARFETVVEEKLLSALIRAGF